MRACENDGSAVSAELHEKQDETAVLTLRGRLDVQSTAACWRDLESRLKSRRLKKLEVDIRGLELYGGIGTVLLRYLTAGKMTPGAEVKLIGLTPEAESILETFTVEDVQSFEPHRPRHEPVPAEVGAYTRGLWCDFREWIEFLGAFARALPFAMTHPRRLRWREIRRVAESAGANALPVIAIMGCLVGLVTALEAAHPLAKFGAQIFIADMIGFASIRDTGPMITGIILAGRSSSAFAAELGTMKVNQELDALNTMGLDPMSFLVVQRVIAAVVLTPLLTLYAMVTSVIGGILVMRFLGFPPLMIFHQIEGRVHTGDVVVGLTKAVIFGVIVGGVGCLRGLQTGKGPSAVGESTTRAVISGILLIIAANTLYSMVQYFLT